MDKKSVGRRCQCPITWPFFLLKEQILQQEPCPPDEEIWQRGASVGDHSIVCFISSLMNLGSGGMVDDGILLGVTKRLECGEPAGSSTEAALLQSGDIAAEATCILCCASTVSMCPWIKRASHAQARRAHLCTLHSSITDNWHPPHRLFKSSVIVTWIHCRTVGIIRSSPRDHVGKRSPSSMLLVSLLDLMDTCSYKSLSNVNKSIPPSSSSSHHFCRSPTSSSSTGPSSHPDQARLHFC